jgi:WD40 repeat protein
MEGQEKLKINIYPPELEISGNGQENIIIQIHENFTNDSKSEKIYENLLAENASRQPILQKYKEKIISSLDKLISASTINPNKEFHLEKTFQCHDLPISKVYFNHKGNYFLTCSYDGDAYLWDRKTGEVKYKIKNHANTINSVVFTRDDKKLLTGSFDTLAMLFDADNGIRIKTFEGHEEEIVEVNMNKEETQFCTASMDLTSKIFDIEEGKCVLTLSGHKDVVSRCSFNQESNKVLTGSYDKTCKIFDLNNGDVLFDFKEHSKEISNCFFYPKDNNIIAYCHDNAFFIKFDVKFSKQLDKIIPFEIELPLPNSLPFKCIIDGPKSNIFCFHSLNNYVWSLALDSRMEIPYSFPYIEGIKWDYDSFLRRIYKIT